MGKPANWGKFLQPSTTTRFLAGKQLPGIESPIKEVHKIGETDQRIVEFENHRPIKINKRDLINGFNEVLKDQQIIPALKSIRVMKDHTATARLGGLKQGQTKTYISEKAAVAAVKRAYGKKK